MALVVGIIAAIWLLTTVLAFLGDRKKEKAGATRGLVTAADRLKIR